MSDLNKTRDDVFGSVESSSELESSSDVAHTYSSVPTDSAPKARRFRKRWLLYLFLLITLGPYLFFRATSFSRKIETAEFSNIAAPEFDGTIRVATWNIAHGRGATFDNWAGDGNSKQQRIEKISELIVGMDADVVVLNEVDFCSTWSGGYDQAATIAEQTGYPYVVKQSNLDFGFIYGRWHFGNVLLSRFPVSEVEVVEFTGVNEWESWLVGCKRGFSCSVELESGSSDSAGSSISVIGLHLESRGEAVRVKEVADVARFAKKLNHPLVIAGDLNTTPSNAPQSNADVNGENGFENLIQATELSFSPTLVPACQELTFPAFAPETTIDWILFAEPKIKLVDQEVITTELSDHLPVVAEFRIEE